MVDRRAQKAAVQQYNAVWKNFEDFPPISEFQALTPLDREAKGPVWVSRATFPAPVDSNLVGCVFEAIASLGRGTEAFAVPDLADAGGEWIAPRRGIEDRHAPEPQLSEREKYCKLMEEVREPTTIVYVHGGIGIYGSPASNRQTSLALARSSGGRCFSVKYRLAPQHQSPAQHLDVFSAYLSLLYPPEGAAHSPVNPKDIVLAGDSIGANFCLAVIQIILCLRKRQATTTPKVRFNGKDVELHMPAGVTCLSPWGEMCLAVPSFYHPRNMENDYCLDPALYSRDNSNADHIWPADPPRPEPLCTQSALSHPFMSPITAPDWRDAPPVWLAAGEERMADGNRILARALAKQNVTVQLYEYELMPHVFPIFLRELPQSKHCMALWGKACKDMAAGRFDQSKAIFVEAGETLVEKDMKWEELIDYSWETAMQWIRDRQKLRVPWTGPKPSSKL